MYLEDLKRLPNEISTEIAKERRAVLSDPTVLTLNSYAVCLREASGMFNHHAAAVDAALTSDSLLQQRWGYLLREKEQAKEEGRRIMILDSISATASFEVKTLQLMGITAQEFIDGLVTGAYDINDPMHPEILYLAARSNRFLPRRQVAQVTGVTGDISPSLPRKTLFQRIKRIIRR